MNCYEEYDKVYKKDVLPFITENDKQVLWDYSLYSYSLSNYLLGKNDPSDDFNFYFDQQSKVIEKVINLSHYDFPMELYHGTNSSIIDNKPISEYLSKNKYINIISFFSTSISKRIAKDLSREFILGNDLVPDESRRYNKILLQVNIPKGYPALWMKHLSFHPEENEVLLKNNTKIEVVDYCEEGKFTKILGIPYGV